MAQTGDDRNQLRLGANVRRLRKERNMTLEDLAHATGMDTTGLSKIERGLSGPRFGTIVNIGRALSVAPAELLRGVK